MKLLLGLILGVTLCAQELPDHQPPPPDLSAWKASVLALTFSASMDVASSWGGYELNPVLGNGKFGLRQATIKGGMTGGAVLIEWLWLRKHPKDAPVFVNINVGTSALVLGIALHNFSVH